MFGRKRSPGGRPDRGRLELLVVVAVVTCLFVAGTWLGVFDRTEAFLRERRDLDELFALVVLCFLGLGLLMLRRWRVAVRETRLRVQTEERYRSVIEQVPTVTYTWDASRPAGEAPVPFISPQVEDLLGYPVEAWTSDPGLWQRIIHPDDRDRVIAESDAADRDGRRFVAEYRAIHRDGHEVWIHDESSIVTRTPDGRPAIAQGVMQDITERKETEARLREAEDQFRFLIEQIPAITYIEDAATEELLYISPQIEAVLGYSAEEWIADPGLWSRCLHPDDRERVLEEDAADTGDSWSVDYRLFTRDGHLLWVHNETVLIRDAEGTPRVWQGVITDITERKLAEERLSLAEERHRLLLEHLPVAVYTDAADEEVTALYVSPQYERITGYSPEERTADPGLWRRMLHPDDRDRAIAESDRTNETGEDFDIEYRIVTRHGETLWLHDHAALVPDAEGNLVWQGVLTDITAKRAAEDALTRRDQILAATGFAAEQLLRAPAWETVIDEVLERLGTAAVASRAYVCRNGEDEGDGDDLFSTRIHTWQRAGYELPETPGLTDRFPWSRGGFVRWAETLREGRPVAGAVRDLPNDDRAFLEAPPASLRSFLLVPIVVGGRWWGFVGLSQCEDVQPWQEAEVEAVAVAAKLLGAAIERQHSARLLADAEKRYRAIVEHVPAAIYIDRADDSLETIYISPRIEDITGIPPAEWIESPDAWLRAVDPVDVEDVRRSYVEAIRRQEPWSGEYRMRTRDGRTIWVHDETTIVHGDGETPSVQGVIYDVTERKLAEEALRASEQRERQAVERLRALDEMKNTFLAAVSHELRSPLTSILGLALTLERSPDLGEAERADMLVRLGANARKLDRLLKDLLDLDRLNRGIVEPQHRRLDVGQLALGTLDSLEALAGREVIREVVPTWAEVDGPKVERIVENLLVNASRHTTEDRRIWLRVEPIDDGVLIAVEDDGPGVPEEIRDAIFEPFRQGPTAMPHAPGTGIGLSLVARFAALHGGRAWVTEREGGGASFRVVLPSRPRVTADDPEASVARRG